MLYRFILRMHLYFADLKESVCYILRSKRASWDIPDNIIKEIARCLLPDVVAYCESDEGKEAYAKCQTEQK